VLIQLKNSFDAIYTKLFVYFPIIFSALFWYLTMFPGVLTPDSFATIYYAVGQSDLSSLHTVAFNLFIKYSSFNGQFIYSSTFLILLVNLIALYNVIAIFFDGRKQEIILITTGAIFFTPFFGPISVSIWKDSVYTPLIIIGLTLLFRSCKSIELNESRRYTIFSVVLITLGSAFRHEGWVVLILAGLLFSVIAKFTSYKSHVKKIIIVFLTSGMLSVFFQVFLIDASDALPTPKYDRSLSFLLDLSYVNSNRPELLKPETRNLLNQISSGASLKSTSSCSSSSDFFGPGFNADIAEKNYLKIVDLWFNEVISDSRETLLASRVCRIKAALPPIISQMPTDSAWPTIGISQNSLGFSHPRYFDKLYPFGYAWNYLWKINGSFIGWPGLHIFLVILILLFTNIGYKLRKHPFTHLLLIFIISRHFVLIFTSSSQDFRYYYATYFISLPFFVLYIANALKSKFPALFNK